jgi:hypothetical protein
MKQETLEEVAENESEYLADWEDKEMYQKAFIEGAKWQQERSYSEEDLEVAFFEGQFGKYSFNDWFEQFKKK